VLDQDPSFKGMLAETALTGVIRYPWALMQPVIAALLDVVLDSFSADQAQETGPQRPMSGGRSLQQAREELHALLIALPGAPFTMQRLAELLLEPRKQYNRTDKLVLALERILRVTSTLQPTQHPPPLPSLSSLGPVNENPPSPYAGEPPAGPLPQPPAPDMDAYGSLPNGAHAIKDEYDMYFDSGDDIGRHAANPQSGDAMLDHDASMVHVSGPATGASLQEGNGGGAQPLHRMTETTQPVLPLDEGEVAAAAGGVMDPHGSSAVSIGTIDTEALQAEAFAEAALAMPEPSRARSASGPEPRQQGPSEEAVGTRSVSEDGATPAAIAASHMDVDLPAQPIAPEEGEGSGAGVT
jgi:hypothetical protein